MTWKSGGEVARGDELHRWYDAGVGRWLSEDPIGFAAGDANLYRYVGNGATNATDPTGEVWYKPWTWFSPPQPQPQPTTSYWPWPKNSNPTVPQRTVNLVCKAKKMFPKSPRLQVQYLESLETKAAGNRKTMEALAGAIATIQGH